MYAEVIFKNARCAAVEIRDAGIFKMEKRWSIYVNGNFYTETERTVTMIYGLIPQTQYQICAEQDGHKLTASFVTDYEYVTLNVQSFGAKGDGISDDTQFIQAAIMVCPPKSRVVIPAGEYRVTNIFLKSDINLEIQKGAVVKAFTEREKFPVFDGAVPGNCPEEEMLLGTWEGESMAMYAGIICGVGIKNVCIYGAGVLDGNAGWNNWWENAHQIDIAARPRMVFLNRCENIVMAGVTVQNSPSWNIHPYFSSHLRFISMNILGPKESPNTDGLDPESCRDVEIIGVYFSVGDDCIAIKSGKIEIGSKYKTPSENISIRQCCMRDGHGSITLGSEMAAGIRSIHAQECRFICTDRGLRIKTRRGRGKDAVIDDILFEKIYMDQVLTPFVINCFYFCEKDGKTEYVQCKDPLPVDERTPCVKKLEFKNIEVKNCHVAAAFFYGLPEQKIEEVIMENVNVSYAKHAVGGQPAMMSGIPDKVCRMGIFANNIKKLIIKNINIHGQDTEIIHIENVNDVVRDGVINMNEHSINGREKDDSER